MVNVKIFVPKIVLAKIFSIIFYNLIPSNNKPINTTPAWHPAVRVSFFRNQLVLGMVNIVGVVTIPNQATVMSGAKSGEYGGCGKSS